VGLLKGKATGGVAPDSFDRMSPIDATDGSYTRHASAMDVGAVRAPTKTQRVVLSYFDDVMWCFFLDVDML
jgi:hypothetical protein